MLNLLSIIFLALVKHVISEIPMYNMEVNWIIQGRTFGFTGFMVEFLGFMKGFEYYIPQLRVMQSFFKYSMNDSPISSSDYLNNDLFPEESISLQRFLSNDNAKVINANDSSNPWPIPLTSSSNKIPSSQVWLSADINSNILCDENHIDNKQWLSSTKFIYGKNMNRYRDSRVKNAQECCKICANLHNCLGWTWNHDLPITEACEFQGLHRYEQVESSSHTSGSFKRTQSFPKGRMEIPQALILHGTSCFYNNQSITSRDPNVILIGRYMLERAKITNGFVLDEYSVASCTPWMDEVWVPTEWHRQTFKTLLEIFGTSPNAISIAVIPEAVDTVLFDPDRVDVDSSKFRISAHKFEEYRHEKRMFNEFKTNSEIAVDVNVNADVAIDRDEQKEPFQFLSIFKWEWRKGWDLLLTAYWTAFNVDDNVVLRLRTYIPDFAIRTEDGNLTRQIEGFARNTMGKELNELPLVLFEKNENLNENQDSVSQKKIDKSMPESIEKNSHSDRALTRKQMRDLLASADAFVLPTRGEGWGLPIAEAMAMRLPVVVTNATGPAAYITEENAYPVQVADEEDKFGFAQPLVESLIDRMKDVYHDSEENRRKKGEKARETMKGYSPEYITSLMVERLRVNAAMRGWSDL